LDFLRNEFNFQVEKIDKVYFYKKCKFLPQIFKNLTDARADPKISEGKRKLLKQTVNYSCGYFGLNSNKNKIFHEKKLMLHLPQRFDINKGYSAEMLYNTDLPAVGSNQDDLSLLISTPRKKLARKVSEVPIPLFINIVETGKLRMAQFLSFLDTHIPADSFRHCYTHVDNCVLILSEDKIEKIIPDNLWKSYDEKHSEFFDETKPGGFKFENGWDSEFDWKFCTSRPQNHVIMCDNQGIVKSAAFKDLLAPQAFAYSLEMLKKNKVTLSVSRRINKLAGLAKHDQKITFVGK
jgi:hypothetical protein